MKKSKVILTLVLILGCTGLIYFVLNHSFEKKIKVLDCEGRYYSKIFEKSKPGYLDFSESNAKIKIANCLCDKYVISKDEKYKVEILKLYNKVGIKYSKYENYKSKTDTICKYKNEIFVKQMDL